MRVERFGSGLLCTYCHHRFLMGSFNHSARSTLSSASVQPSVYRPGPIVLSIVCDSDASSTLTEIWSLFEGSGGSSSPTSSEDENPQSHSGPPSPDDMSSFSYPSSCVDSGSSSVHPLVIWLSSRFELARIRSTNSWSACAGPSNMRVSRRSVLLFLDGAI